LAVVSSSLGAITINSLRTAPASEGTGLEVIVNVTYATPCGNPISPALVENKSFDTANFIVTLLPAWPAVGAGSRCRVFTSKTVDVDLGSFAIGNSVTVNGKSFLLPGATN